MLQHITGTFAANPPVSLQGKHLLNTPASQQAETWQRKGLPIICCGQTTLAHLVHDVYDSSDRQGFPDQWVQRGLDTRHELDQRCASLTDSSETTDWCPGRSAKPADICTTCGFLRSFKSSVCFPYHPWICCYTSTSHNRINAHSNDNRALVNGSSKKRSKRADATPFAVFLTTAARERL